MKNNVLIFIDNIRPIENILGLIRMSEVSTLINNVTIVGKIDDKYITSKINVVTKINK